MANKGTGVGICNDHGEFFLDAPDSPCPSCEDDVPTALDVLKEMLDQFTVDEELWDELDEKDDGDRVIVEITYMDLKRAKIVLGK